MWDIRVQECGVSWANAPGQVTERPRGVGAWQVNCFHDPILLGKQRHRVEAPAVVIFAPQALQWYVGADGGFRDDWFTLSGADCARLFTALALRNEEPVRLADTATLGVAWRRLHEEKRSGQLFSDLAAVGIAIDILCRLARRRHDIISSKDDRVARLDALRASLRRHCEQDWSVPRMAQEVGVSVVRLQVLYKKHFGISPLRELVLFRMERALELLKVPGSSVASVADACGYHDAGYFRRVFKRFHGAPPSRLRARSIDD